MTNRIFTLATVLMLWPMRHAAAQPIHQPLVRGDVAAVAGWLNVRAEKARSYDEWYNRIAYGGLLTGLYWTDHLKTELEAGISSTARSYQITSAQVGSQVVYGSAVYRFNTRRVILAQQYQFFENAWFHPHIGGGVDLTWEKSRLEEDSLVVYDATRFGRIVRDARTRGPETDLRVRPFASTGFKGYMTPRAFVRSDLRFMFRGRVEEVSLRFGVGVDF